MFKLKNLNINTIVENKVWIVNKWVVFRSFLDEQIYTLVPILLKRVKLNVVAANPNFYENLSSSFDFYFLFFIPSDGSKSSYICNGQ